MKRLYLSLIVLVLIVVGVGFYQGWFALSSGRQAESHKVDVNLTVDPDKMKEDAEKVKDKTKELTGKATDRAKDLGNETKDKPKSLGE